MTIIVKGQVPITSFPLDDVAAWGTYSNSLAHLFDRMWVARTQGIVAHPHGVAPAPGEWISKPIVNLLGMGVGARPFRRWVDDLYQPGHFWMPRFTGRHTSVDYVLAQGRAVWAYQVDCEVDSNGTFWAFHGQPGVGEQAQNVDLWLSRLLPTHTGVVNVEIIEEVTSQVDAVTNRLVERGREARVIEVHLRPNPDFLPFYGMEWVRHMEYLLKDPTASLDWPKVPGRAATVLPIRVSRDAGNTFELAQGVAQALPCETVALDFKNGESVIHQPNDPWTYRLALVGDVDAEVAGKSAETLVEQIKPLGGVLVPRVVPPRPRP